MRKNFTFLVIVLISIFILSVFFVGLNKSNIYDTKSIIGNKISPFQLKSLKNNYEINQDDLKKNNYTLINFWSSWCKPCRLEHEYLLKLKEEMNIKVFGINFKDSKKNALKFLNELGNPYYLIAYDKNGKKSIQFGIYGVPESILIDKNLIVIKKFIGPLTQEDILGIKKLIK